MANAETPAALKPNMTDKNFGLAEFKSRRWRAELTEAQAVADTAIPDFWRHQADKVMGHDKLNPAGRGDIIEIYKPDTAEYVELLICEIGAGFIKTRQVSHSKPEPVAVPESSQFTTKWNVGKRSHDVIRKADGTVMKQDFQTKESAMEWIKTHIDAMAA